MAGNQNPKSLLAFILACAVILAAAFSYPKWTKERTEATLSWDVMGFYLYLPATFIYKDLKQLTFKDDILKKYNPTSSFYQAYPAKNGNYVMKYPIGLAILYAPFFALASLVAWVAGYPNDGFSFPYQFAISWGGISMSFLGLWVTRKNLLKYFSDEVTAAALLAIVLATNYLNYSGIGAGHTHNWLFTIYALLIHFSIKWHQKPTYRTSVAIGACVGIAALTRPTDIISFLIPLFWGFTEGGQTLKAAFAERLKTIRLHSGKLLTATLVVALFGCIQLIYWKYVSGNWIEYSYQDQGFSWDGVHLRNTFFSFRKGWLIYTPIMSLALIGFYFLYRKNKALFWPCFIFSMINIYIAFSWDIWWYGGSFGQRAMIQGYAILIFPLAAFFQYVVRSKISSILVGLLCAFFVWLNLLQTYQAHFNGILDPEYMTEAYYWRVFGKTKIKPMDKKLLDTDEDFIGERKNIQNIYTNDFERMSDSLSIRLFPKREAGSPNSDSTKVFYLDKDHQFTPILNIPIESLKTGKWIRVSAKFYAPQKEWDTWRMAQLVTNFKQGEQNLKYRAIRVHRFTPPNQWIEAWIDMSIPDEAFDKLEVYFWNANGTKLLYIDDVKVETYDE